MTLIRLLWTDEKIKPHPDKPVAQISVKETRGLSEYITKHGDVPEPLIVCRNGRPGRFYLLDGRKMHLALKRLGDKAPKHITVELVSPDEAGRFCRKIVRDDQWTDEEIEFMQNNLHLGYAYVAEALGRTETAVKIKRKRTKTPSVFLSNDEWLTVRQAALALGIEQKSMALLVDRGLLPAIKYKSGRRHDPRFIKRVSLYRFATNPKNWPYFIQSIRMLRRIKDEHLRRLIERRMELWNDEWISAKEAAEIWNVNFQSITSIIWKGGVYQSATKHRNWWLLRSEVESIPLYPGKGKKRKHLQFSKAGDAFILSELERGSTWEAIAKKMKQNINFVAHRGRMLKKNDNQRDDIG